MPAFFGFIFKHQAWLILAVIASFSFALMFWAALTDSLTFDETAHITAAYSHLKLSDYRLVVEPLPLTDFLAGAPLLFQDLNFPLNSHAWQREVADVWVLGKEFIYQAGNRAEDIALSARLGIITSAILGVFFIYFWSRELIGRRWAFLPAILFAFSPSVLAHGHYVTSDILAALGMVIAAYFFLKYLKNPSPQNIFSAGLILGLAELTKPAALILAPLFIILACVWIFFNKMSGRGLIGGLLLIFFISFILIYSAYFFLTLNYSPERSVNFAKFALGFLDEARAEANLTACSGGKAISTELMAKCMIKNSLFYMAENAFLKPIAQYFLDIWLVFKQAAAAHYPTYFMGGICDCGRWYYFPTLFLLKEPLPFLILFIAALAVFIYLLYARFAAAGKSDWKENLKENLPNVIRKNFAEFSMILFIIIYAASSMRSEVNLGYRHFMPVLPFLYILTASAWRGADFRYKKGLVFVLLGWYVAESFLAAPYFLPYFNQLGGGLKRGYDYAVDSNYDWGQDLGRLADWAGKNAVKGVSLSYFGTADPKYYLGSRVDIWRSEADNEIAKRNGWFAASVHLLKQYPEHYLWLDKIKDIDSPDYRAGASIFVYKL